MWSRERIHQARQSKTADPGLYAGDSEGTQRRVYKNHSPSQLRWVRHPSLHSLYWKKGQRRQSANRRACLQTALCGHARNRSSTHRVQSHGGLNRTKQSPSPTNHSRCRNAGTALPCSCRRCAETNGENDTVDLKRVLSAQGREDRVSEMTDCGSEGGITADKKRRDALLRTPRAKRLRNKEECRGLP